MMYIIKRAGRRFNNKVFTSYEEARKYVVKWLRVRRTEFGVVGYPCMSDFNFSVTKVNG